MSKYRANISIDVSGDGFQTGNGFKEAHDGFLEDLYELLDEWFYDCSIYPTGVDLDEEDSRER